MTILIPQKVQKVRTIVPPERYEEFTVHGFGSPTHDAALAVRCLVSRIGTHDPAALVELTAQVDRLHLLLSGRIEARDVGAIRVRRVLERLLERLSAATSKAVVLDHAGLRRVSVERPMLSGTSPVDGVAGSWAVDLPATDLRSAAEAIAVELGHRLLRSEAPTRTRTGARPSVPTDEPHSLRVRVATDSGGGHRVAQVDLFMSPTWTSSRQDGDRWHQEVCRTVRQVAENIPGFDRPDAVPLRIRSTRLIESKAALLVARDGGDGGATGGLPLELIGYGRTHPNRAGWWLARNLARRAVTVFGAGQANVRVGIDEGERRFRVESLQTSGMSIRVADLVDGVDLSYAEAVRLSRSAPEGSPSLASEIPSLLDGESEGGEVEA